ncbi:hypothetical protein [Vibrio sp. 10N.239.312.D08]|uniref:hypothetical protein n=1 Tax=Vibrio sp. 10N.239.312.D08 TaxID=3229978 RepID=UPI00355009B4
MTSKFKIGNLVDFFHKGDLVTGLICKNNGQLGAVFQFAKDLGTDANPRFIQMLIVELEVSNAKLSSVDVSTLHQIIQDKHRRLNAKCSKGDYGYIEHEGDKDFGMITKGATGTRKAVMICEDGSSVEFTASMFIPTDKPLKLPEIPEELAQFSLHKFKHFPSRSRETIAFEAVVEHSDGRSFMISNTGHGECYKVEAVKLANNAQRQALELSIEMDKAVRNAAKRLINRDDEFDCPEVLDTYLMWLGEERNQFVQFAPIWQDSVYWSGSE